jgi:hypothetical protein
LLSAQERTEALSLVSQSLNDGYALIFSMESNDVTWFKQFQIDVTGSEWTLLMTPTHLYILPLGKVDDRHLFKCRFTFLHLETLKKLRAMTLHSIFPDSAFKNADRIVNHSITKNEQYIENESS